MINKRIRMRKEHGAQDSLRTNSFCEGEMSTDTKASKSYKFKLFFSFVMICIFTFGIMMLNTVNAWCIGGCTFNQVAYDGSRHWEVCSGCGNMTAFSAHKMSSGNCVTRKSCSCGYKGGYGGHSYNISAATCTIAKQCKICDFILQAALGHKYNIEAPSCTEKMYCTRSGCTYVASEALGHLYDIEHATCTEDKVCTRDGCGYIDEYALGHDYNNATPTCTEPMKCTRCGIGTDALGHDWVWQDSVHMKMCTRCGLTETHDGNFIYLDINTEKCSVDGCKVTRGHIFLDGWEYDNTNHWKLCSTSGCIGKIFQQAQHEVGVPATCLTKAICGICGAEYGDIGGHSYITCSKRHCTGNVCSKCGFHNGTCTGGCNSNYCNHCAVYYCNKTTKNVCRHTCVHNSDGRCDNSHCEGITWCTLPGCDNHVCIPCNTNGICPEPHCSQRVCSVCSKNHQGECGGGHKYKWITNDTGEVQTHTNKCYVTEECPAINGTHTSNWGRADSTHKSICIECTLEYTHDPQWKVLSESVALEHPCAWPKGCDATHTPVWGAYYKIGEESGTGDGNSSDAPHTRKCEVCESTDKSHTFTTEPWTWLDNENHKRTCSYSDNKCGLTQVVNHKFGYVKKDENDSTHEELYKHWNVCTQCDPDRKEADEEHTDNGYGVCSKCDQLLWKAITVNNENITEYVTAEDKSRELEATQEQKIKIVEVVDNNGNPKVQYIQNLTGADNLTAADDVFTIIKNGEYNFQTGRGGTATLIISNISRDLLIDKIIDPITSTTVTIDPETGKPKGVTIILRPNRAEENYKKKICIVEDDVDIPDETIAAKEWNDYKPFIKEVTQNGTYYFTAEDSAGNRRVIKVVVDNIIKGQTTVAVFNDVFVNGYIFTDILVNPNKPWNLNGNISEIISATAYKSGEEQSLGEGNIKFIKVMDMLGNVVTPDNSGNYPSGNYYINIALGGSIFNSEGTYVIDLVSVVLNGDTLDGKNRIVVDVQQLKDLT